MNTELLSIVRSGAIEIRRNIDSYLRGRRLDRDEKLRTIFLFEKLKLNLEDISRPGSRLIAESEDEVFSRIKEAIADLDSIRSDPLVREFGQRKIFLLGSGSRAGAILDKEMSIFEAVDKLSDLLSIEIGRPIEVPGNFDARKLKNLVPVQKPAPVGFQISDGRLSVARNAFQSTAYNERGAVAAREQLERGGIKLLDELRRSNCDRRLVESFEELQMQLKTGEDIIKLGISNICCNIMAETFSGELPEAVNAMLVAHTKSIDMYAAQFPDWANFVENAANSNLTNEDISQIHASTKKMVDELRSNPDLVEPEVPRVIEELNRLLENPKRSSKRAAYAVLRASCAKKESFGIPQSDER